MRLVLATALAAAFIFPVRAADGIELKKTAAPVIHGVDLGIADDETFHRPNSWGQNANDEIKLASTAPRNGVQRPLTNEFTGPASRPGISIAWRNAAQVEEVEVRVRNLGDQPGVGRIYVSVLDGNGASLLKLEPPDEFKTIRIPAYADGGREGKIIRMKSSRALNNIIDQFDRAGRRYDVRATVETVGAVDANLFDNSKTKSWNVEHRAEPGQLSVMNYVYKNIEDKPVKVRWVLEHTPYPRNWVMGGVPTSAKPFVMQPGQELRGTLTVQAPMAIDEGAFLESRLTLVNADTGEAWQQREWFLAYDTIPPTVTDYRLVATADHRIAIQVLVADQGSGVKEATGVSTQFSTDGGLTWAAAAHNYKAGNFVVPTLFEAVIGPFAAGTNLQLRFTAKDTVGNTATVIPADAVALLAPAGAEKLLEMGLVFPRTQPNAIFYLEPGQSDVAQIADQFSSNLKSNYQLDAVRVEDIERLVRGMPITADGKSLLLKTALSLQENPSKAVAAARLRDLLETITPTTPADGSNTLTLETKRLVAAGSDRLGNMSTLQLIVP